jgi:hypothetical protein
LNRIRPLQRVAEHVEGLDGTAARLVRELVDQANTLTAKINERTEEITALASVLAPALMAHRGPRLRAADRGEDPGRDRRNEPLQIQRCLRPAQRDRTDADLIIKQGLASAQSNREPTADTALHRIALAQARWHLPAKTMMQRRTASGNSGREAFRVLKRRLSDVVYAALQQDLAINTHLLAA